MAEAGARAWARVGWVCLLACFGCGRPDGGVSEAVTAAASGATGTAPFEVLPLDAAPQHVNGRAGELYMPELYGPGVALFDFDGDGDLDVYLVQGQRLGPDAEIDPSLRDTLLRNDLEHVPGGATRLSFTDVTASSGIVATGYGMGVAAGDVDNDGHVDLYVTAFGANQLWRNRGDGTFVDGTPSSGTDDDRWSVAAAFFDFDRDGWLDLYVGNYLDFGWGNHRACRADLGFRDYCSPLVFPAARDALLRNRGDGTFVDATGAAGIGKAGAGLGVATADFDRDGWTDLYVANDQSANFLWHNQGDGTFVDIAAAAGAAVNGEGVPEASMGVVAADLDDDGDDDLVLTHLAGETHTVYLQEDGLFLDRTTATGIAGASRPATGFGVAAIDVGLDGRLDLFVANGEVKTIADQLMAGDELPFRQPDHVFIQHRPLRFASARPADDLGLAISRGVARGDLDNDGDEDLVVTHNGGRPLALLARGTPGDAWVGLRLLTATSPRDSLGAHVEVRRDDGSTAWRRVAVDGSYASASDTRIVVGLPGETDPVPVVVHWPGRKRETFGPLALGRYHELTEGTGRGSLR